MKCMIVPLSALNYTKHEIRFEYAHNISPHKVQFTVFVKNKGTTLRLLQQFTILDGAAKLSINLGNITSASRG